MTGGQWPKRDKGGQGDLVAGGRERRARNRRRPRVWGAVGLRMSQGF